MPIVNIITRHIIIIITFLLVHHLYQHQEEQLPVDHLKLYVFVMKRLKMTWLLWEQRRIIKYHLVRIIKVGGSNYQVQEDRLLAAVATALVMDQHNDRVLFRDAADVHQ